MGKPEGEIEDYLVKQAKKQGFLCWKFTSPSTAGVPDRVLIGHGQTVFIEVKAPGEVPRPLQVTIINDMKKHGAAVHVVDDKEQIDHLLAQIKNGQNHKGNYRVK